MTIGIVGRKAGMTRIFNDDGVSVPVTVISVEPNRVTQVKTMENDGYRALQVTAGSRRASRVTRQMAGHYAKAGTEAGRGLWEFRLADGEGEDIEVGKQIGVDIFEAGQKVDVAGTTIGKGYAGGVKRHNFRMQDATHGNSISHRAPDQLDSVRRLVVYSRVRRWLGIWGTCVALCRISKLFGLTVNAICCWSRVRCPVLAVAT